VLAIKISTKATNWHREALKSLAKESHQSISGLLTEADKTDFVERRNYRIKLRRTT